MIICDMCGEEIGPAGDKCEICLADLCMYCTQEKVDDDGWSMTVCKECQ